MNTGFYDYILNREWKGDQHLTKLPKPFSLFGINFETDNVYQIIETLVENGILKYYFEKFYLIDGEKDCLVFEFGGMKFNSYVGKCVNFESYSEGISYTDYKTVKNEIEKYYGEGTLEGRNTNFESQKLIWRKSDDIRIELYAVNGHLLMKWNLPESQKEEKVLCH